MLLSTPNEIQLHIISFLDLPSLNTVLLVSHHLHELAIGALYETVTISDWTHLCNLFSFPSISKLNPTVALERAQHRCQELGYIKHLVLDFPLWWIHPKRDQSRGPRPLPSFPISKPLSLNKNPLSLESLRVSHGESIEALKNVLRSVNPRRFSTFGTTRRGTLRELDWGVFASFGRTSWDRLESWSYVHNGLYGSEIGVDPGVDSSPFKLRGKLDVATVLLPSLPMGWPKSGSSVAVLKRFLDFCPPKIGTLRVLVAVEEDVEGTRIYIRSTYGTGRWETLEVVGGRMAGVLEDESTVWEEGI